MEANRFLYKKMNVDERRALASTVEACEICSKSFRERLDLRALDHDHETGFVRGVICSSCNVNLGWVERSLRFVTPASRAYLRRSGRQMLIEPVALPPALTDAVAELAAKHERTLSKEIEHALRQYIREEKRQ